MTDDDRIAEPENPGEASLRHAIRKLDMAAGYLEDARTAMRNSTPRVRNDGVANRRMEQALVAAETALMWARSALGRVAR